jgi:vesicle transport protein SEC22
MLVTLIARVSDDFPLVESMEDEKDHRSIDALRADAKAILKRLTARSPGRCSVEAGAHTFHYVIRGDVAYLSIAERQFPKRLAFMFLDEVAVAFEREHGAKVAAAVRPYPFMRFDQTIQRAKRQYADVRSQRNVARLNDDLQEIEHIMKTNIAEVLGRGERIDELSSRSSRLQSDSMRYVQNARKLNYRLWLRKYAPLAAMGSLVAIILYLRFL